MSFSHRPHVADHEPDKPSAPTTVSTLWRRGRIIAALSGALLVVACGGGSNDATPGSATEQAVKGVSVPAQISVVTATE